MGNLEIKYEDEQILLAVKPAGVATQSRREFEPDMVSIARSYRAKKGEPDYIGLVHRLDQPVGGLLLFGKTKEAAANLSRQVQEHRMEKYYLAWVCGQIEEEGILTDYLYRDGKTNTSRVVQAGTPEAKKAVLQFWKRKEEGGISLVEIRLETGRHHQIRVQMAHHGFPLAGDRKYNPAAKGPGQPGLGLFAWKLCFFHPKTGKRMEFKQEPQSALGSFPIGNIT